MMHAMPLVGLLPLILLWLIEFFCNHDAGVSSRHAASPLTHIQDHPAIPFSTPVLSIPWFNLHVFLNITTIASWGFCPRSQVLLVNTATTLPWRRRLLATCTFYSVWVHRPILLNRGIGLHLLGFTLKRDWLSLLTGDGSLRPMDPFSAKG
ncbi:hypothetical protein I7I53_00602 [Histoplasma capsulatum var. duboisii H88]|uniref:Secreted protein n=1 Tax=Ajellomyces capsulatus (strain H88) TaxID=544711 RepID=A0A8A1LHK6_AJEC8|nr:hypothetical protein I7I53_00602 [Histoplasma capsulatum var. duboisii H88]